MPGPWRQIRKANTAIGSYLRGARQWLSTLRAGSTASTSVLIVGPSSAGKSTLIASPRLAELGLARPRVVYGFELAASKVPANALIHYNMLHLAEHETGDWATVSANWDFMEEPNFNKILTSGLVEHCIVLVAPVAEMVERMQQRTMIEESSSSVYRRDHWIDVVQGLDLCRIYEQLFNTLEEGHVPYTVLYSSSRGNRSFVPSIRASVRENLMGRCTNPQELVADRNGIFLSGQPDPGP